MQNKYYTTPSQLKEGFFQVRKPNGDPAIGITELIEAESTEDALNEAFTAKDELIQKLVNVIDEAKTALKNSDHAGTATRANEVLDEAKEKMFLPNWQENLGS